MVQIIANAALEIPRNPKSGFQPFSAVVVSEVTRLVGKIPQSIYNNYENANQEVNISMLDPVCQL